MGDWCRRRFAVFVHVGSGTVAMSDLFELRLDTMLRRIRGWVRTIEGMGRERRLRLIMVTLTYDPKRCEYGAGDIREYVKFLKRKVRGLVGWAWVAETHRDGRIHYHMLVAVEAGTRFPMPDKPGGGWPYGASRVATARSPWYLVTYLGKEYQKDLERLPKGLRLYGVSVRDPAWREVMRALCGLAEGRDGGSDWRLVGTCVTREYAEHVLMPKGEVRGSLC